MSFLEMVDVVNERLTIDGQHPVAFDSDCREGICGACGMMIKGVAHGPTNPLRASSGDCVIVSVAECADK